ncbi:MAG: GIY-YIG nuclease family protein [Candidatus Omnitrophica bacterium]|nr:GIY-YIG nuclease family protein [Candidatus Omnitrophota bacterium]MDD5430581.1 GIY-YIG nuclease family protein [Candidatus Omnitrophota bacterium]
MYYVYVLQSVNNEYIYVGSTRDLKRRIQEHNHGKSHSTKKYVPLKLIYYEAYIDKKDASSREQKLKHHGSAIGHLKKRLVNSLAK